VLYGAALVVVGMFLLLRGGSKQLSQQDSALGSDLMQEHISLIPVACGSASPTCHIRAEAVACLGSMYRLACQLCMHFCLNAKNTPMFTIQAGLAIGATIAVDMFQVRAPEKPQVRSVILLVLNVSICLAIDVN